MKENKIPECPSNILAEVYHSSLQKACNLYGDQLKFGPACFSFAFRDPACAAGIHQAVKIFTPAASLGAVESLLERRLAADPQADPRLVRISVGLEDLEDLFVHDVLSQRDPLIYSHRQADLAQAFHIVSKLSKS